MIDAQGLKDGSLHLDDTIPEEAERIKQTKNVKNNELALSIIIKRIGHKLIQFANCIDETHKVWKVFADRFKATRSLKLDSFHYQVEQFTWSGINVENNFETFLELIGNMIGCGGSMQETNQIRHFVKRCPMVYKPTARTFLGDPSKTLETASFELAKIERDILPEEM